MRPRRRQLLSTAIALLAVAVLGAKIFKAYQRGQYQQSSVRPLHDR